MPDLQFGSPFRRAAFLVVLACLLATRVIAAPSLPPKPQQLIAQAEQASLADPPRFLHLVERLHRIHSRLDAHQRQTLQFFDGIVAERAGHGAEATRIYEHLYKHASDPLLAARARAELIERYQQERKYFKAYTLAHAFMQEASGGTDPKIQHVAWKTLTRILISQERYQRAEGYARKLMSSSMDGQDRCIGGVFLTQARLHAGRTLKQEQPDFRQALTLCGAAGMPGYANGLRLEWAGRMVDENHPDQAIAHLEEIAPQIHHGGNRTHLASLQVTRARALFRQGHYAQARQAAQEAVADAPKGANAILLAAYRVLYRVEQHDGHARQALTTYNKYVEQYKATAENLKAQALAYQMVRQDVQTNRMRLAELARQNRILQLQQALARKSAETGRLYILLLSLVLVLIAFWAYRIKHSQLRFRKLARHDDLTGVCNRQYFFEQVEQILSRLQKARSHACFLILDMDHFKRVNDLYGHVSGDQVLQHVVRTCQRELRATDLFGRLGGEEFGILIPAISRSQGAEMGDRIRRALANTPIAVRDQAHVTITASIGLASTEVCGYRLKSLLVAADDALYAAKRSGRNRLIMHTARAAASTTRGNMGRQDGAPA